MADQLKVLVVDDEEPIRDSCRQVLTKAGYECHTAVDGIERLHFAHQVDPDLVLLDLMMPGMDGLSMLDQLLKTHPNVVCIVITGYATIESAVDAMKHGAFDFLPKPFTPDELRVIVTRGRAQHPDGAAQHYRRLAEARADRCGRHRGSIHVESEVGKGTSFFVRLPEPGM